MADARITELDALTDPVGADLLAVVDDVAGTPITKKLTLATLIASLALGNVVVQTFGPGSGTYTPTAGMKKALAIVQAAGGAANNATNTDSVTGGGGGGGAGIRLYTAAEVDTGLGYVVGTPGNDTTFGTGATLITATPGATGGAQATGTTAGTNSAGGAGGTCSGATLNIQGGGGLKGMIWSTSLGSGGGGGSSFLGGGGQEGGSDSAGTDGGNYGGGGSGGHASGTPDRAGGAGGPGVIFILEFIG